MKKRLFVTGGMGYIGSHTLIELAEHTDYELISLDSFQNSVPHVQQRLERVLGRKILNEAVDLCDMPRLEAAFQKYAPIEGIIHFAALKSVPDSVANPVFYYRNNLVSLLNVLECVEKYQVKNFIFSSSCAIYGEVAKLPVFEGSIQNMPQSPYAHTKQMGERIIQDFMVQKNGINCIILRYFNPVGAHVSGLIGEEPLNKPTNLLPLLTRTAAGLQTELLVFGSDYPTRDGSCIRDYVHVSDIAQAHVLALKYAVQNPKMGLEVFNLGSGEGVSVLEAIHTFQEIIGKTLNYRIVERRAGDLAAIYSDSSHAAKHLGWRCQRSLADMLESAWKWQQTLASEQS